MDAFLFPGQGSQKVGMGRALCERHSWARETFERANDSLGYDLRQLCFDGPPDELTDTRHAQPALLTVGYLCWRDARERGSEAGVVAGHSLGEYTALVASDALDFEDALRLVARRAELMSQAPPGTMAALIGLADDKLDDVLNAASGSGLVVAANYNSPGQIVVSGEAAAVEAAMAAAKTQGAKMAVRLPVSGAFHSPLLEAAGREMAHLIAQAPMRDAAVPVVQNATAQAATTVGELKAALSAQMTAPVRWTQSVRLMAQMGATTMHELGPGNVLAGLVKRIDPSVTVVGCEA